MEQSREYMLDIIQKEINPNNEFTILNTIIIEKSTWRKHIIRWFNIEWIITLNLHTMRNMHLLWEEYYIPVMIWDVFEYIREKYKWNEHKRDIIRWECFELFHYYSKYNKSVDLQSDECIRYIYSLLPPEVRK